MLVTYSAVIQIVAGLPVAAAAESLPDNQPKAASRFWLAVSVFPPVLAALLTVISLVLPSTAYLSPHLERIRPHMCARHLANAPDALWHFHLAGSVALALIAFATLRFAWRWASSARIEHLASDMPGGNGAPLMVPSDALYSFALGVRTGFVVISSSLARILAQDQLKAVVAHENKHILRGDNRTHLLMELAATLTLPSPLGFVYLMKWRASAEEACDRAAAEVTSPETVAGVLQLLNERETERVAKYSGGLVPVYRPGISPAARAARIKAAPRPQLAPPLAVILVAEGLLALFAIVMARQWLADAIYCAGETILAVMLRN